MAEVDLGDRNRGYYKCRSKSRKSFKCIFMFLLNVAITNAYISWKIFKPTTECQSLKEFRIILGKELIGNYSTRRRRGRIGEEIPSLPLLHFPMMVRDDDGNIKRGRCTFHSRRLNIDVTAAGSVGSVECGYVTKERAMFS